MTSTTFRLPIEPMPTPRPRARVISMRGRKPIASFYSPAPYKAWQKAAAEALSSVDACAITGPCVVKVVCEASRPKTTKLDAPKPDVDNYAKGVLDAITKDGRFWADDSQVVHLVVVKRWTRGEPGIDVSISQIPEE